MSATVGRRTPGSATASMTRVLFLGVGVFGVGFAILGVSQGTVELPTLNPVWLYSSFTLLLVLPIAIIVFSRIAPLSVLRGLASAHVVVFSVALLTWPLAIDVSLPFDAARPWILGHLIVANVFAGLLLPEAGGWAFIAVSSAVGGALRVVAYGPPATLIAIEDAVFNVMVCTILVAIAHVTLRAGRARDEAADATARSLAHAAASAAQSLQRERVAALLHDDVISTLIVAGRFDRESEGLVRGYARKALGRLDAVRDATNSGRETTTATELGATLRTIAQSLATDVRVEIAVDDCELPAAVGEALIEATSEALRNSQRHGSVDHDRRVRRSVTVETYGHAIGVRVEDDGDGFDVHSIPVERFGIAVSIHRRMALAGGQSSITSTPGRGTIVELEWSEPHE